MIDNPKEQLKALHDQRGFSLWHRDPSIPSILVELKEYERLQEHERQAAGLQVQLTTARTAQAEAEGEAATLEERIDGIREQLAEALGLSREMPLGVDALIDRVRRVKSILNQAAQAVR